MKVFKSFIVKNDPRMTDAVIALAEEAGITLIPETVLPHGQIRMIAEKWSVPAYVENHREGTKSFVDRDLADSYVTASRAVYMQQSLLIQKIDEYIADPDLDEMPVERMDAQTAKDNGAELVIVAIIGDDPNSQRVIGKIINGQQSLDKESLIKACKKAQVADSCFLIRD